MSECRTNKTSCSFSGLLCGEVYTIGVAGVDDNCTGQQSDTVSLYTGNTTATISVNNRWLVVFLFLLNCHYSLIHSQVLIDVDWWWICFLLQSHVFPLMCPASWTAAMALLGCPGLWVQMLWATLWKPSALDRPLPATAPVLAAHWVTWSVTVRMTLLWQPLTEPVSAATALLSDKIQVLRERSTHIRLSPWRPLSNLMWKVELISAHQYFPHIVLIKRDTWHRFSLSTCEKSYVWYKYSYFGIPHGEVSFVNLMYLIWHWQKLIVS